MQETLVTGATVKGTQSNASPLIRRIVAEKLNNIISNTCTTNLRYRTIPCPSIFAIDRVPSVWWEPRIISPPHSPQIKLSRQRRSILRRIPQMKIRSQTPNCSWGSEKKLFRERENDGHLIPIFGKVRSILSRTHNQTCASSTSNIEPWSLNNIGILYSSSATGHLLVQRHLPAFHS